jgi:aerobic-type carbon monoxide dehydrogenase small subunit (CoxS/CutS family)
MELVVNGVRRVIKSDPDRPLLYVLRDELDLTGAKYGCGEGQCGACTVLLDGSPVRSCITPLKAAQSKAVATIESLEREGRLHPVQEAFIEADALQCGYCTAGMIMSAVGLLAKKPSPSDAEIRSGLQGNVCRCGTYPRIVDAVRRASRHA